MAKLSNNSSTTTQRKSYLLSVTPVEYSLTEGTNIPAPEHSPTRSPAPEIARPPTPGRGPLNSHPASFDDASDMQVDSDVPAREQKENGMPPPAARMMSSDGASSFRTPTSPASAAQHSSSSPRPQQQQQQEQQRRPSGVRKLFSLSNLRNSFSSSRNSLAMPRRSNDRYASDGNTNYSQSLKRPSSPSMLSTTASTTTDSQYQQQQPQPRLRTKKSGSNWLRRKSGMFTLNSNSNNENGELDSVAEDNNRPETRESKRVKQSFSQQPQTQMGEAMMRQVQQEEQEAKRERERERDRTPPPLIPEIGRGSFSGGDLGWDEGSFSRR